MTRQHSRWTQALVISAIRFYQRRLSPHKGFCCAYRAHTGRQSCSTLGLRAVRRYGALTGLAVLRRRLYLCGVAHRRYGMARRPALAQRGDCDCDLPCDFDFSGLGSCVDCGSCDWGSGKKKDKDETRVHIPPGPSA